MKLKAFTIVLSVFVLVSVGGCPDTGAEGDPNNDVVAGDDPNDAVGDDPNDDADPNNEDLADDGDDPDNGDGDDDPPDDGADDDPNDADPNDPNDDVVANPPETFEASGAFTGDMTCVVTGWDSLTNENTEKTETIAVFIDFDGSGEPDAFTIPGYLRDYVWRAEVANAGDSVTLNHTEDGGYEATLTVTVATVSYTATTGQVVLNLVHHGEMGALIEDGVGLCAIQFELDGQNLTYTAQTSYEVDWDTAVGDIETTENYDCQGVLAPEP